jgi:hypothetical protein
VLSISNSGKKEAEADNIVQYALFQIIWSILYYASVAHQNGAKPTFHVIF